MNTAIDRALAVRTASLYLPVLAVALALWWRRPARVHVAAAVAATAWTLPALLALNKLAPVAGWWRFDARGGVIAGMPADLWIGWALLWGALPPFLVARARGAQSIAVAGAVGALIAFDLVAMPQAQPVLVLSDAWLVGEALALVFVLLPAIAVARWTAHDEALPARGTLQLLAFAGLVFFVIPETVFASTATTTRAWAPLLDHARWRFIALALLASPFAAAAIQAVREFVTVGSGTPVPLDPPKRLVTTGPYAYVANPMQLGGTVLLIAWGLFLANAGVVAAGVMAAVFSAGLAALNEHRDLDRRFTSEWRTYRQHVRLWLPRWRPYARDADAAATLDVATTCAPCTEVGDFFTARRPVALMRRPAEERTRPVRRITYTRADRSEQGIGAVGRALEHCNLGWAVIGWIIRLPGLQQFVQLIADASGAGPRNLPPATTPAIWRQ